MTNRQRKQRKELINIVLITIGSIPVIIFAMLVAYQVGVTM